MFCDRREARGRPQGGVCGFARCIIGLLTLEHTTNRPCMSTICVKLERIECILHDSAYPITHGSFLQDTRLVLSLIVTVEVDASHSTCDLGPDS